MLYVLPPSFAERKEVECGNWIWGTPEARGNGCHLKGFSWNGFLFLCSFFGHFSHRSEWQLIKIDYKSIYGRKCAEEDYQTWHLHNQVGNQIAICLKETDHFLVIRTLFATTTFLRQQGEPCVMGQKQIFMKRRPGNYCMLGKDYSRILSAESCICRAHDFEW